MMHSVSVLLLLLVLVLSASASPSGGRVSRNGSQLMLNGQPFRFAGANIYWLGLDENVPSNGSIAYPTKFRQTDALITAIGMGARVVRSHTLGVSCGNPLSF